MNLKNLRVLVTGGAGFVGSHLVDKLVSRGCEVIVFDNLSTGSPKFLENSRSEITFLKQDLLDKEALEKAMKEVEFVFHMAANADIRQNLAEPEKCLQQNTIATSNVLEAVRKADAKGIAFASTGSVYGEPEVFPTPENAPFPKQTSLYAASKLACEGLLQAYSEGYGLRSHTFRFVSLMGERYTHGCVFDFCKKLLANPRELEILGNGKQKKSYLYVKDCVEAMLMVVEKSNEKLTTHNLGHEETIEVTPIAEIVCREMGLKHVELKYTGGERGWVGDSPFILLDTKKIRSLGWKPTLSIPECVKLTAKWILDNKWVLERK